MTQHGLDANYVEHDDKPDQLDQLNHADRRFHTPEHSQDTWALSPKNPRPQIDRPSDDRYYLHTPGSLVTSSLQGDGQSVSSGQPGLGPPFIPPAPTPPSGRTWTTDATSTTNNLYGPDRLYGRQLSTPGYGRGIYAAPAEQAAQATPRVAGHDQEIFGGFLSAIRPDSAGDLTERPVQGDTMASANPLNVAGTLATAFPGAAEHNFKDSLAREACNVTPGVDDTPYILYALDALTGNVPSSPSVVGESSSHASSGGGGGHNTSNINNTNSTNTDNTNNIDIYSSRHMYDEGQGYYGSIAPHGRGIDTAATAALPPPPALPQPVYAASPDRRRSVGLYGQSRGGDGSRVGFPEPGPGNPGNPIITTDPTGLRDDRHSHGLQGLGGDHSHVLPNGRSLHNEHGEHYLRTQQQPCDRQGSNASSLSTLVHTDALAARSSLPTGQLKDSWIYLDKKHFSPQAQLVFPSPDFKPAILRAPSLGLLIVLCLLMIAGLMFSAIYSEVHKGLVGYSGSIYGGQYFVFRILPQILAGIVLLYAQSVALAIVRIRPFARMEASGHVRPDNRNAAIFDSLYPRSFLWPQVLRVDPWQLSVPLVTIWLMNFAVPIQSALFSVVLVDDQWRWATVQGVAWTLVAFYVLLVVAAAMIAAYWRKRQTGLIWDPRSIADFVALASHSRTTEDYRGSELLSTRSELRKALHRRTMDKLGYWAWRDGRTSDTWHGIGTEVLEDAWLHQHAPDQRRDTPATPRWDAKRRPSGDETDVEAQTLSPHSEQVRYRYLPWCLRSSQVVGFVLTAFALLLALFIVSFLPSTSIRAGFPAQVRVVPAAGAFSGGNFLYSFLPALLGQIMYLLFCSLDLSMRILQPWAALSKNAGGVQPEASILADYAACLPLQSAWHAMRNRHWRVAGLSLMTTVFAFLPALAGGLFLALTIPSSGEVRMTPNMVLYGFVLALLVLYFLCLVALLPGRRDLRLPHAVTCIAEVLSFCTGDDLMREPAFKNARSKETLRSQLGVGPHASARSRWIFATGTFGDDRRLGIHRVRRYTELTNRPSGRRAPLMAAA